MVAGVVVVVGFLIFIAGLIVYCMNDENAAYEGCYWEMESNGRAFSGACGGLGEGSCEYCPFNVKGE